MTEDEQNHLTILKRIAETPTRFLSNSTHIAEVNAIAFAMAQIERLTTENADLKSKLERESNEELTRKIADLAVLCVNTQCEVIRLKRRVNALLDARLNGGVFGRGELKKEVIE